MLYCKKCGAQMNDGVSQCILCGADATLLQSANRPSAGAIQESISEPFLPPIGPPVPAANTKAPTGVHAMHVAGRPLLLTIFVGLYVLRCGIDLIWGILALTKSNVFGAFLALICGALILCAHQLWNGAYQSRYRFIRLMLILSVLSAIRLFDALLGTLTFLHGMVYSNAGVEALTLAVSIAFLIYLNTAPVKQYCGD